MFEHGPDDTIAAVSTPPGPGGIGILRLSGSRAVEVAGSIFRPFKGCGSGFPVQRAVLGEIRGAKDKKALDEGYLIYFRSPRSYTRQDVIEISCHGSPAVLEEALRLAIRSGARQAEPGEFTFRAFLNGRMDILQAEAVDALVRSYTLPQARAAFGQMRGGLSAKVEEIRIGLVDFLADLEAAIEFPDDGIGLAEKETASRLAGLSNAVERLIEGCESGRVLRDGLKLAIAGRANTGKSTLFNALLEESRAIVSPEAGTTRDFLREKMLFQGALYQLVDMAGLGAGRTPVEREGIRRGRDQAGAADGILFVFDLSRPVSRADTTLARSFPEKKAVFVFNKRDRKAAFRPRDVLALRPGTPGIEVSALRGDKIDALRDLIHKAFGPKLGRDGAYVIQAGQKIVLEEVRDGLQSAVRSLSEGYRPEILAEELRAAAAGIGRLTARISPDEVITSVFARFCLGK